MKPSLTKREAELRLKKLRATIDHHRYLTHVEDRQEISEAALDSLKHELQQIEAEYPELITPDSPSQRVAGQARPEFKKVSHPVRMFSLTDVFSFEELQEWDTRWRKLRPEATTKYLVDAKLDGLAISLTYRQGLLVSGATRGDGQVGEDVTANLKTMEAIPLGLRTRGLPSNVRRQVETGTVIIRGEVVMHKADFEALNRQQKKAGKPVYANPRNVAAGSLRQLDPAITASRNLQFYAWELVTDLGQATLEESYALLKQFGLRVNPLTAVSANLEKIQRFYLQTEQKRQQLPFWIDGVVVKLNQRKLSQTLGFVGKTPRAAVAWKFSAEQATTVVEAIDVQVGRTGALTPVAHLRPVQIAGTTVARATLHNADEIQRLDVRVGDTVIIQKAGDIIPEVMKVLPDLRPAHTQAWTMPTRCPVCHQPVKRKAGEAITYCVNRDCPAQHRERLYHFVSKHGLDIDGLGPSTIDMLVDERLVQQPADLFTLTESDLVGLPLFADKKSAKVIAAIQARRHVPLNRLIFALGIRHVGEETARTLAQHFGTLSALQTAKPENLERLNDIGDVVAASIAEFFADPDHRALVRNLAKQVSGTRVAAAQGGPLQGKSVVVTGSLASMTREQAHQAIREAGGKVVNSVSKKTSYLVAGEAPGSKLAKARSLNVPVLTEAALQKLLNR